MASSALSPSVVQTELDGVFYQKFEEQMAPGYASATTPSVFVQETMDKASFISEQASGSGMFTARAEGQKVAEGVSRVGNQKVITAVSYDKQELFPKRLFRDDSWKTVRGAIKDMGRKARLSQDQYAFERFNLGQTTEISNDGVALFSNSHVLMDGGSEDNLATGALSVANLNTMFLQLARQKTQDSTLGGHKAAVLLVPPALFKLALEITDSERASGTADNDMNYFSRIYPGLQVLTSEYLGAYHGLSGSDVKYYLLSKDHSMTRFVRQGMETHFISYEYRDDNQYVYKAGYREAVASISWEGMVGSTGV
jgi:hypothetical protein